MFRAFRCGGWRLTTRPNNPRSFAILGRGSILGHGAVTWPRPKTTRGSPQEAVFYAMIHGYDTLPASCSPTSSIQPFRAVFTRRTHCGQMASRFSGGGRSELKRSTGLFVTDQLLLSVLRCQANNVEQAMAGPRATTYCQLSS